MMPTLTVQVLQLGWTCSKCETSHLCHQSAQMQCLTCGAGNQRARSMEAVVAWLEACEFEFWTRWATAPGSSIAPDYAAATIQFIFQQIQTTSAELQMDTRGEYDNSMLLVTPWESVHKGELTRISQDYSPIESGFADLTQRFGLSLSSEYFTKQQRIKCGEYRTLCPNLLCDLCSEMEIYGCLAVIWKLNPAQR